MFSAASTAVTADLDTDDLLLETARVTRSDRGLRASGYLVRNSDDAERAYGSWYELLCDPRGELRRLTIRSDSVFGERSLSLTRAPEGPWVLDRADGTVSDAALADASDVVLAGSLLTLSLPAHRLGLHASEVDASTEVEVAVIDIPEFSLSSERVTYRTLSTSVTDLGSIAEIAATGGNGDSVLSIDADGLLPRAAINLAR